MPLHSAPVAAGGSGLPSTVQSKTANYTASSGEFVLADATTAGFTVTLPTAPAAGALVVVKKTDGTANVITVAPAAGGTIDDDPNATITSKNFGAVLEHTGSNVWKIAAVTASGGSNGVDGKMLRNGTIDPTSGVGTDGDFYLNTATSTIFGPKTAGAWPAGASIKGANGAIAQVQDESSNLTVRGTINFVGGGVTATDDAANSRTNVTIPSATVIARGRPYEGNLTSLYVVPGTAIYAHNGVTMSANRIIYEPFIIPTDITIDQMALNVNAAVASSTARLAIYTADANWQPVSLVVEPTVTTQIDTSTTSLKTVAVSQSLPAGRYLKAFNCSGGIQIDCALCPQDFTGFVVGTGPISSWFVASTYAAFSSTPVAWTSHSTGNTGFAHTTLMRVSTP